jgi:hypothetical protein
MITILYIMTAVLLLAKTNRVALVVYVMVGLLPGSIILVQLFVAMV